MAGPTSCLKLVEEKVKKKALEVVMNSQGKKNSIAA